MHLLVSLADFGSELESDKFAAQGQGAETSSLGSHRRGKVPCERDSYGSLPLLLPAPVTAMKVHIIYGFQKQAPLWEDPWPQTPMKVLQGVPPVWPSPDRRLCSATETCARKSLRLSED